MLCYKKQFENQKPFELFYVYLVSSLNYGGNCCQPKKLIKNRGNIS